MHTRGAEHISAVPHKQLQSVVEAFFLILDVHPHRVLGKGECRGESKMDSERLTNFLSFVEAPEHGVNEVLPRTWFAVVVWLVTPGLFLVAFEVVGQHAEPAVTHVREGEVLPHVLEVIL